MILAPRSCPSKPGLATTTRIFFSEDDIPGARQAMDAPAASAGIVIRTLARLLWTRTSGAYLTTTVIFMNG